MSSSDMDILADFEAYVDQLSQVIGHADRVEPLHDYCTGLLLPVERKSVEPLAAAISPLRTAAKHQSLLHFVNQSGWSDEAVLTCMRDQLVPVLERRGRLDTWVIDDTSFPKKGKHSVGVARQYCGQLGKQDNCQVAVSLSITNAVASLPIAYRLYLPKDWAEDEVRRKKAHIPADIAFQTKPEIALSQVKAALVSGLEPGILLADAGYGVDGNFRAGLRDLGMTYSVGVQPQLSVWRPGEGPLPPPPFSGRGRPPHRVRHAPGQKPTSAKALAINLPVDAWHTINWREGSNIDLSSRFAAVWTRTASRELERSEPHPEEWLLIEWPEGDAEPLKYWLSNMPRDTSLEQLVAITKRRWRIERDYLELKQEIGLGHYEGRGWRGFHHHGTLCIVSYAFLILQKEAIPPSVPFPAKISQKYPIPSDFKPRGHPLANTATPA